MQNTEEIMEEKLEELYEAMLKDIVILMDEKKLTLSDISDKISVGESELESYFSLEKKNFSMYDQILKIVGEW